MHAIKISHAWSELLMRDLTHKFTCSFSVLFFSLLFFLSLWTPFPFMSIHREIHFRRQRSHLHERLDFLLTILDPFQCLSLCFLHPLYSWSPASWWSFLKKEESSLDPLFFSILVETLNPYQSLCSLPSSRCFRDFYLLIGIKHDYWLKCSMTQSCVCKRMEWQGLATRRHNS